MRYPLVAVLGGALASPSLLLTSGVAGEREWAVNATAIEACSCPMFCPCYFSYRPAAPARDEDQGGKHYCRANVAYRINRGYHGATRLDGAKFWMATDLGDDLGDGELDWTVLYFDKGLSPAQRNAVAQIVRRLFSVKWKSFQTAEGHIDKWELSPDGAHALLDGGRTAEVRLKRFAGMTDEPVVLHNLQYWRAPRNDGLIMMPNEVEAYRVGPRAFEFKRTTGFLVTVDLTSKDFGS